MECLSKVWMLLSVWHEGKQKVATLFLQGMETWVSAIKMMWIIMLIIIHTLGRLQRRYDVYGYPWSVWCIKLTDYPASSLTLVLNYSWPFVKLWFKVNFMKLYSYVTIFTAEKFSTLFSLIIIFCVAVG